jgi:hypothetical protein
MDNSGGQLSLVDSSGEAISIIRGEVGERVGDIMIYPCSQTVEKIDFKRNCEKHAYMNMPFLQLIEMTTPLADSH